MHELAHAIEDAGCADAEILTHRLRPGEDSSECWVIDSLLGNLRCPLLPPTRRS
jgi:hypothetical protein